jgi:RNA polymerase sigma factor (sigma-70 family)
VDLAELCQRALAGDAQAWRALVQRATQVVWGVTGGHRLNEAERWDVCQNTIVTLVRCLAGLRDPERLAGWLATTARREASRMTGQRREVPLTDPAALRCLPSAEVSALSRDRDAALWRLIDGLPPLHRELVWLLAHRPELTYRQLAERLGIPPGSVGPLRTRSLQMLRRALVAEGFDASDI